MTSSTSDANKASNTWFCPDGHNVLTSSLYTDEHPPECGACGSPMSTDSGSHDVVHLCLENVAVEGYIS